MATPTPTFEQILRTVRRWPVPRRQALLEAIADLPGSEGASTTAQSQQSRYRMGPKKRRRMAELLAKGNEGTITGKEKNELNALVQEFEIKTLAMAKALVRGQNLPAQPTGTD